MALKAVVADYLGKLRELIAGDVISPSQLGLGTADTTTFLRGDNTWAIPAGGGGGGTPRYAAYTTVVSTDANIVAVPGTSYSLLAATLTTNKTINLTAINAEADYLEFDNQEAGFTWGFIGGSVIDSYGNSVTTLLANARYILRRSNNQIKIFY